MGRPRHACLDCTDVFDDVETAEQHADQEGHIVVSGYDGSVS